MWASSPWERLQSQQYNPWLKMRITNNMPCANIYMSIVLKLSGWLTSL